MKKSSLKLNESTSDVDKAKRIYRASLESIRRLDDIIKQKKSYRDVFLQESVGLRSKLKDYCERLMFYNPLEYGRKAEEVLWRKVFYDIIQLVKKNRRHVRPNSSLESAYRTHLAAASGYYNHLLFRFQSEFGLKLEGLLDFHLVSDQKSFKRPGSHRKNVTPAARDWSLKACHRCLICLGDLARYQQEFDQGLSTTLAERYYYQALALFPDIGMPHNQLGTLSGSRYLHFESAYHYIRCLACEKTFDGAHGNLKRLLEKNRKWWQELQKTSTNLPLDLKRSEDIKKFFVNFLDLLDVFFDTSRSYDAQDIQEKCQTSLQNFNFCMFYEPVVQNFVEVREDKLQYLDDTIVYRVVVICMATIYLLQKNGSQHFTAAVAFLLALFSHILNHIVIRLQNALYEKTNPNKIFQACNGLPEDLVNGISDNSDEVIHRTNSADNVNKKVIGQQNSQDSSSDKPPPITRKKSKSKLRELRRRRRRCTHSDEENSSLSESDLSEGERDVEESFISEDSDDDLVNYFDHDSESDLSDSMAESQNSKSLKNMNHNGDKSLNNSAQVSALGSSPGNVWLPSNNLAEFSSELFSSSNSFLKLDDSTLPFFNGTDLENANDVIEGKEVSIPPGFATTTEAKHVAEITQKLSNFVIETDTELSAVPTDTDLSIPTETENDTDDLSSIVDKTEMHRKHILEVTRSEGLLAVIKIVCDWMMCYTNVIKTCAQTSQSLWCRLAVLLNFLPSEKELLKYDDDPSWSDDLLDILSSLGETSWKQTVPLQEDINLQQFPPLFEIHSSVDFSISMRGQMREGAECLMRIACLLHFGHYLASIEGFHFSYNEEQGMFFGPSNVTQDKEDEKRAQQRMMNAENRRNQLMRDMAQLRLQAEVSQLEGSLETNEQPTFPPYIIPDTSVLCESLTSVKQLSQTARSIIIIPLSVIDALDLMKKESSAARDAIRWLEAEFRKGNRYIRAQKSHERGTIPTPNLKKKNKDVWTILEILDCGMYFSKRSEGLNSDNMVAIVTKRDLQHPDMMPIVKEISNSCLREGVSIENIGDFTNKWKSTIKSKG